MNKQNAPLDADSGSKSGSLGFGTVIRGVRRRPIITLLIVILAGAAAASVWMFLPLPKLTCYTTFQVSSQPVTLLNPSGGVGDFSLYRQNQVALVKSRPVLNSTLPILDSKKDLHIFDAAKKDKVGWLETKLQVDFKNSPDIMRLSLEGDDEEELKFVVGAVKTVYLTKVEDKEKSTRRERFKQLEKLLADYNEKLSVYSRKIADWAEQLGSSDPASLAVKEKYLQEQLGQAERELLELQSSMRRSGVDEKKLGDKFSDLSRNTLNANVALLMQDPLSATVWTSYLLTPPKSVKEIVVTEYDIRAAIQKNDPVYQDLLGRVATIEKSYHDLKKNLQDGARPRALIEREEALAEATKEADAYFQKVRPAVAAQLKETFLLEHKRSLDAVRERLSQQQDYQSAIDADIKRLSEKLKKSATGQLMIESFRQEMSRAQIMSDRVAQEIESMRTELEAPCRVTVLENPEVVNGIEGNRRLKYTLMTLGGILVFGLGFLTFLEARARRVGQTAEVTESIGLSLIGTIPAIPKNNGSSAAGVTPQMALWQSALVEAVDATRAVLVHALGSQKKGHTILVSSAMPGEGKTMLSCHLASSLARAGHKTLIIDGDMRRPSVHSAFGASLTPGLCELLRGETAPVNAIQSTIVSGLSFVPAGHWNNEIKATLSTDRWPILRSQMESEFDFVVIDSSPLLLVTDPLFLARHTDGLVLSVLHDVSKLDLVTQARDRLKTLGIKVLGVVVSGLGGQSYGGAAHAYYHPQNQAEAATPVGHTSTSI